MKNTKKMYAGCYYLLKGEANANSCFIENMHEAKLFIKLADRYLRDYVKIHEYLLTAEGWMLQVTIKKSKEIRYQYQLKRNNKINPIKAEKELWYIISEQVRLMLSQYVLKTNKLEGRTGSKVKESYKRYYFETAGEAKAIILRMKNQKIRLIQRNKKYRKLKTHYRIPKEIGDGSVFLCSKWIKNEESKVIRAKKIGFKKLYVLDLDKLVLTKMLKNTYSNHLHKNSA